MLCCCQRNELSYAAVSGWDEVEDENAASCKNTAAMSLCNRQHSLKFELNGIGFLNNLKWIKWLLLWPVIDTRFRLCNNFVIVGS